MTPVDKRPRRSVLIAARLITVAVGLAGAEGILWFAGYPNWWAMDPTWGGGSSEYECDAELGWRAREGHFNLGWADGSRLLRSFEYTNWSGGRRATAQQEPPCDAVSRPQVLFFGDSYVQGYGLSDSETLPWIVQKRHPELQISNFGGGLYGTYQSYLAMQTSVRGPSAVYYLLNTYQAGRNAADASFLRIMKKPPRGCFYPYAVIAGGEIQPRRSDGELVWSLSRRVRTVAMAQDYILIIKSYLRVRNKQRLTEALLARMHEIVRAQGGKFTVILLDLDPDERRVYRRFLESQGVAYVDCDRPELKDNNLRLPDGHPNGRLNELLAQWIDPVPVVPAEDTNLTAARTPAIAAIPKTWTCRAAPLHASSQ